MDAWIDIGPYTGIMVDRYIQISETNGEKRWAVRCSCEYDNMADQLVVSQPNPTTVRIDTNYHRLVLHYDDPLENNQNQENNGRIELYERNNVEEAFVNWVFYQTGIPQDVIEQLQDFVLHPENHPMPPDNNNNNNNNNNNGNGGNNNQNNNTLSTVSQGSLPSLRSVQSMASTATLNSVNHAANARRRKTRRGGKSANKRR